MRIALALKGLPFDYSAVNLLKNEHLSESYAAISVSRMVPLLRDGAHDLTQSLAIIEYLDEIYPQPSLLPGGAIDRARIRAIALDIACEIHPLANLRILRYLILKLKTSEEDKNQWCKHWIELGLEVVERKLAEKPSTYCHGETPSLADCVLIPQIVNAQRYNCQLAPESHIRRVYDACMKLSAFEKTHPDRCTDWA